MLGAHIRIILDTLTILRLSASSRIAGACAHVKLKSGIGYCYQRFHKLIGTLHRKFQTPSTFAIEGGTTRGWWSLKVRTAALESYFCTRVGFCAQSSLLVNRGHLISNSLGMGMELFKLLLWFLVQGNVVKFDYVSRTCCHISVSMVVLDIVLFDDAWNIAYRSVVYNCKLNNPTYATRYLRISGISFLINSSHLTIRGTAFNFPLVEPLLKLASNGLSFSWNRYIVLTQAHETTLSAWISASCSGAPASWEIFVRARSKPFNSPSSS